MKVYIVPYRDRAEHLEFFTTYLPHVEKEEYGVFVVEQCDQRPFNRGAMKNIGFLAVKKMYPNTYQNITLVFNDVDIMPYKPNIFHNETTSGVVRHNYGYTTCLSASFVIKAGDFEKTNGFPNLWTWGLEDYFLQERVLAAGLTIDRSKFRPVGDRSVLQFFDGMTRSVSTLDVAGTRKRYMNDGLQSLQADFTMDFTMEGNDFVKVKNFKTVYPPDTQTVERDIRTLGVNHMKTKPRLRHFFTM